MGPRLAAAPCSLNDAAGAPTSWDAGSTYYWYDANGAMNNSWGVSRQIEHVLNYDERGMPTRFYAFDEIPDIHLTTWYRYNADGQRYWKKPQGGSGTFYAMDGAVTTGVIDANWDTWYWNIVTPNGEVLGREEYNIGAGSMPQGRRYYLKDHLGSLRVVLDGSGNVVETRDHYPFGIETPGRSSVSGQKASENFTGHELDAESGLIYAGARHYMPGIGRWMSVDPLADLYPGHNPYSYALNNPVRLADPTGLCPIDYREDDGMAVCEEIVVEANRLTEGTPEESDVVSIQDVVPSDRSGEFVRAATDAFSIGLGRIHSLIGASGAMDASTAKLGSALRIGSRSLVGVGVLYSVAAYGQTAFSSQSTAARAHARASLSFDIGMGVMSMTGVGAPIALGLSLTARDWYINQAVTNWGY